MDILKVKRSHTQGGTKHITEREKEYEPNNLNIMLTTEQINRLRSIINIASRENKDENEMIVKKLRENRDMLVIFHKNIKNGLHFE